MANLEFEQTRKAHAGRALDRHEQILRAFGGDGVGQVHAQQGAHDVAPGAQLQNTMAPAAYIWDQAQTTINALMAAVDTLNYYKTHLGSVDAYLGKFQDVAYYRGSPCFSASGCSAAEWAAMDDNRRLASESQKRANDALFHGLELQQQALKTDARTLEQLQRRAEGARGQMEAIQFANQLASQQANQLLQIRGLLIAQQNAMATRAQSEADLAARQQAARLASTERRGPDALPSSPMRW